MSFRNIEIATAVHDLDIKKINTLMKSVNEESQRALFQKTLEETIESLGETMQNDFLILIPIIQVIQLARKNNLLLDLSNVHNESLSTIIKEILLLKPSDAEWLINNMKKIPKIDILFGSMDYATIRKNIFSTEESNALIHCLSEISFFVDDFLDLFKQLVKDYIQINSAQAVALTSSNYKMLNHNGIFNNHKIPLDELYKLIIKRDSPNSLKAFFEYVKNKSVCSKTFSPEDALYSTLFDPVATSVNHVSLKMLSEAIDARAPRSVAVLLDTFVFLSEQLAQFIRKAIDNNDPLVVLALCRNNVTEAASLLFPDSFFSISKENQEQLSNHLLTLLRFSPIEVLDNIVNAYNNECNKAMLLECYHQAKEQFLQYAPVYSRYTKPADLTSIDNRYGRNTSQNCKEKAKKDMEYGKKRSELVTNIVKNIKNSTSKQPFVPTSEQFCNLPSSKNGSKIFAAMLEKFSEYNYINNPNASNRHEFFLVNQLRGAATPLWGYDWGIPLVDAVSNHSQSKQIIKYKNLPPTEEGIDSGGALYSLIYDGKIITNVSHIPKFNGISLGHGRLPLKDTIGDIEDLIEKMSVPLKKNPELPETAEEIREYQEALTEFYKDAARLAWLIGNTTPMYRGSGSVAEMSLKALFELQGLQAPTLKIEFPQLDVLDIIFPLDDYIKLFPYFCEPSSLPQHLRKPSLSPLSAGEQLIHYYKEINALVPQRNIEEKTFSTAIGPKLNTITPATVNAEVKMENNSNPTSSLVSNSMFTQSSNPANSKMEKNALSDPINSQEQTSLKSGGQQVQVTSIVNS